MEPLVLETERLVLSPFTEDDVPEVARFCDNPRISENTATLPHPYREEDARTWIASHPGQHEEGRAVTLAIRRRDGGLVGAVGITLAPAHDRGELGYWVGVPYWSRGYATEAARAMVRHGFAALDLHRIMARHLVRNPASGRVLEKAGFRPEGVLRGHVKKGDAYEDTAVLGLLRVEWEG